MIPATEWNRLLSFVRRYAVPLAGENCTLAETQTGTIIRAKALATGWRHPWQLLPEWDAERKTWVVRFVPGFLDGLDPVLVGGIDPEKTETSAKRREDISILDGALPITPAPWTKAPPPFFAKLGVRDPMEGISTGGAMGIQISDESWRDEFRPEPRSLAKVDIILRKARAALSGGVQNVAAGSGFNVIYQPSYNTTLLDQLGARGRISAVAEYAPPPPPTLLDRLMGNYEEPQEDIFHLSRLWFLSPPGSTGGGVDETWEPMPQHFVNYNLRCVAPLPEIPRISQPITLATGLAGGMFDPMFNAMLAPGNDAAQQINSALQTVSTAGKFHTV